MKPESYRAYLELSSFGVEELSSAQAAQLMETIEHCPECQGQWVVFSRTISTLSQVGELPISHDKSSEMWLVCVHHAKEKLTAHVSDANHSNGHAQQRSIEVGAQESAVR